MSSLSEFWGRQRRRWYRRRIDPAHELRRRLAYYVIKHGFEIGDYSYGAPVIRMFAGPGRLIVGRFCSIAEGTQFILGGNHRTDWVTTYPFIRRRAEWPGFAADLADVSTSRGDIVIGSDVWIGTGATILSGVRIGDGAAIGALAVVAQDVAPYGVVVGNPGRLVRKRFPDGIIDALLDIRWWDFEREKIISLLPLLQSNQIEAFIDACRSLKR
jgi:acetyltransferase-like isoleucine patch superfamily enzyme